MKRLKMDWEHVDDNIDYNPYIRRYVNFLKDRGLRASTIGLYVWCVKRYLDFAKKEHPTSDDFQKFRESMHSRNLARSTINNHSFAIKRYHEMLGEKVDSPILKRNDDIPYYFDSDDVLRIFSVCRNFKHLVMFKTLFYGCLRTSELSNLDDSDVDLKNLTLRIREGKGGRDGIVNITNECALALRKYLDIRPVLEIDGRTPLFYTDYGKRWSIEALHRIFTYHKKRAGIEKKGGVHVFSRHTPATIMVSNGCDIRIVKEVLRHKDIRTTLRYAHVADKTKREKYEQYLTL